MKDKKERKRERGEIKKRKEKRLSVIQNKLSCRPKEKKVFDWSVLMFYFDTL